MGLAGCNYSFGLPESATEQGNQVTDLWRIFTSTAIVVGGLVWGLILWSVLRYRRRSDELPKQTLFNIPLEVAYTLIPLVIVAFLLAATIRTTNQVTALTSEPDLTVEVTGFQWQWRFTYPEHGIDIVGSPGQPPELVLPLNATVRVELTSTDVIHAFWVPEFMVKWDAIPDRTFAFDMQMTSAGFFDSGRCAEYCGLNHDSMNFGVRVLPEPEFNDWLGSAAARDDE